MINGLYLDQRVWGLDISPSRFWRPEAHGVNIDLYNNKCSRIAKQRIRINKKYKFAITTSVWEKPIRRSLQYLREQGIKIFLLPREPFKCGAHKTAMFSHPDYLMGNKYFFTPDVVLAPGVNYAGLWSNITKTYVTGYSRFELYIEEHTISKIDIANRYDLNPGRKWIFFPDYPPIFLQELGGKIIDVDIEKARDDSILALEGFARESEEYQVVVKLHPHTSKSYGKYGIYVSEMMQDRMKNPSRDLKIIDDSWYDSTQIARDLLTASDIIAGFASTMFLEAAVLRKPSVHMLFDVAKDLVGIPEYGQYMPTVYNAKETAEVLSGYINNDCKGLIKHYLCDVDGGSCERICNAIKESLR